MYNTFFLIIGIKMDRYYKKVLPKLSYKLLLSPKDQKLIWRRTKNTNHVVELFCLDMEQIFL